MQKTLFLIITLFACGIAYAREDVVYYNNSWIRSNKRHASYYRKYSGQDSMYKVEDYFLTGQLFRSGYRISVTEESYIYRMGHYVFYDSAGHKMREGDYDHGRRNGVWNYYYPGQDALKSTEHYSLDTAIGHSLYYDAISHKITRDEDYENRNEIKIWKYKGADSALEIKRYFAKSYEEIEYDKNKKIRKKTLHGGHDTESSECYNELGALITCDTINCYNVLWEMIPCDSQNTFVYTEQMPAPTFDLQEYLSKQIKYPEQERKQGIEKRVVVKFVVDEDGTVTTVTLPDGVNDGCDREAIRVVSEMPAWKPGLQNGVAVRVYFNLPISFKLK